MTMPVKHLLVVHFLRPIASESQARFEFTKQLLQNAFQLETCQRHIFVLTGEQNFSPELSAHGVEHYEGEKAYEFLLRLSCGLESALKGETDIFGQLKTAWKNYYPDSSSQDEVSRVLQFVFEDTKEIRHQYLQSNGGQSYGSLIRLWMRKQKPEIQPDNILLYGTGLLARSVFPYVLETQLVLANRSENSLRSFFKEVLNHSSADPSRISIALPEENLMKSLDEVSFAIFCIPQSEKDELLVSRLLNRKQPCEVIHLGIRRGEEGVWNKMNGKGLSTLDDLLDLQKGQGDMRSLSFKKAEMICHERAKHRALGLSLSHPHGWEDLALFS